MQCKTISIQPQINAKHACCITGQTVWFSSIHKHNAYTSAEGVFIAVQQSIDLDLQYSLDFSHPCLRDEPFMWMWMLLYFGGLSSRLMEPEECRYFNYIFSCFRVKGFDPAPCSKHIVFSNGFIIPDSFKNQHKCIYWYTPPHISHENTHTSVYASVCLSSKLCLE